MEITFFPRTVDELKRLRDGIASTPAGGAATFAVALATYDEDPKLGMQFLTLVIDMDLLVDGPEGVGGKQPRGLREFRERNGAKPYIGRTMFQGTSPKDGYKLPPLPLRMEIEERPTGPGETRAKVFVRTTGADLPKPMQLARNDKGIWKAVEWSSFQGNCRPPEVKKEDPL